MQDKLNKIIELLDDGGSEPEYLNIKTPIEGDPKGWCVILVWMHHDGDIEDYIWRGPDLDNILTQVLTYLKDRNEWQEREHD